jgi:DnaB helicase-like protein
MRPTFSVLGGETDSDKTAVMLTIVGLPARQGHDTVIYDNADHDGQHTGLAVATGRIRHLNMRTGRTTDAEWMSSGPHARRYADWPVWINGRPRTGRRGPGRRDTRLARWPDARCCVRGRHLRDDLHGDHRQPRTRGRGDRAGLKNWAYDLEVPVVVTSQLNRGALQRTENRPQLEVLRCSSALAHLADTELLVHRPVRAVAHPAREGHIESRMGTSFGVLAFAEVHAYKLPSPRRNKWGRATMTHMRSWQRRLTGFPSPTGTAWQLIIRLIGERIYEFCHVSLMTERVESVSELRQPAGIFHPVQVELAEDFFWLRVRDGQITPDRVSVQLESPSHRTCELWLFLPKTLDEFVRTGIQTVAKDGINLLHATIERTP